MRGFVYSACVKFAVFSAFAASIYERAVLEIMFMCSESLQDHFTVSFEKKRSSHHIQTETYSQQPVKIKVRFNLTNITSCNCSTTTTTNKNIIKTLFLKNIYH